MKPDAVKQLDETVAVMLAELNSANILRCARQARQVSILLALEDNECPRLAEELTSDLSRLYRSVLVLERDPEVIRRNALAAVLMSLSPVLVGVQDLVSSPDFPLWKVGMEGLVLGLEVMGTTQYLEAAKLISGTEYECGLWELEGRAMEWIAGHRTLLILQSVNSPSPPSSTGLRVTRIGPNNVRQCILSCASSWRWFLTPPSGRRSRSSSPHPEMEMAAHPVSTLVNNPKFDDPRCIQPVK